MRLLFLARELPFPPNNGTRLRTLALLKVLAAQGHDLTVLAFGRPAESGALELEAARRLCGRVEVVPLALGALATSTQVGARLRSLLGRRPHSIQRFASPPMRRLVRERLAVDAVICDVFTAVNLPAASPPVLLNNENVEHTILRRYCDVERNPAKRAYAWLEYLKMRRWERRVCARARIGLACSDADVRTLAALRPSLPFVIAPNVVELEETIGTTPEEPSTVLFQGGMDWFPNRDAVTFFATAIFPRVRALVPEARFVVAGRNPSPDFVRSVAHDGRISFTGTVDDMRQVIARAAVSVAPLRIGSGTRLKILEAAALGKPVVSTSVGAEGLDFVPDEEILIADDPLRFAESVARLLGDPARRRAMGAAARRRVEQQYSLAALGRPMGRAISALADGAPGRPERARVA